MIVSRNQGLLKLACILPVVIYSTEKPVSRLCGLYKIRRG